jgi:hypothetical protein
MRPALLLAGLLAAAGASAEATWEVAAGPTRTDGGAVELARSDGRWEAALGYVSGQFVNVRTEQDTCYAGPFGPTCSTDAWTERRSVPGYAYLSVQRRFRIRPFGGVQPDFGVGVVGNSDTNAYVSSPVTFSLSAGLRFGRRWSLEWRHFSNAGIEEPNLGQDMLLIRAAFGGR